MDDGTKPWQPELPASILPKPPELPQDPMDLLASSWAKAMAEDAAAELEAVELAEEGASEVGGNPFAFAPSDMSQLVIERIMSQTHSEVSPLTPGRPSTSSGPLNGGQSCGSLSDSPPVSPSDLDDAKFCRGSNRGKLHQRSKTVGRWLKDRKERKKEEARAHNAELHATISVAAVAAAVAAIAAGTAAASSSSGKDGDRAAKTDLAMASAATLVAAHCVEAAEAMGAEREHLAAVISSAVNVRTPGDVITVTAAAATALRGAATLKARLLKEVWNTVAEIPVEKSGADTGLTHRRSQQRKNSNNNGVPEGAVQSDELSPHEENFLGVCSQELLAHGTELLKRTRKGALHWKNISVYVHRTGNVMLKMKSRHVAGTITKKKKSVVTGVCKEVAAWPGRHLLEAGEQRRYFGLLTAEGRVIEFECGSQREYQMWTQGVSRLLNIVAEKKRWPPTPCRRTIPGYSYSV